MTSFRNDLSLETVQQLLHYSPETGEFLYKAREKGAFGNASRAFRMAGKPAGMIDKKGYLRIKLLGRHRAAHRLAWLLHTGNWPEADIDHKNGNKSDNRIENLRPASRSQNCANVPAKSHNKLGIKGVCFKPRQGYHAQIKKDGRVISLGHFDNPHDAHAAYVDAAHRLHGEFAKTE